MKLIINNKEIIDIEVADTSFARMKGLMFQKEIKNGLLIKPCNSVHTFFMKKSIDILYLNKQGKIIKMTPAMKPWRVGPIVFGAKSVIELPENTIQRMGIQLNDIVYFTNE